MPKTTRAYRDPWLCDVPYCNGTRRKAGYCQPHFEEWRLHANPGPDGSVAIITLLNGPLRLTVRWDGEWTAKGGWLVTDADNWETLKAAALIDGRFYCRTIAGGPAAGAVGYYFNPQAPYLTWKPSARMTGCCRPAGNLSDNVHWAVQREWWDTGQGNSHAPEDRTR